MLLSSIKTLAIFILAVTAQAQNYTLKTVAGHNLAQEGAAATQNYIRTPDGVAIDSAGNVYFSDTSDNRVWKIDTTGKATTYAGTGVPFYRLQDEGAQANTADLFTPTDLAIDGANNLYICDLSNNRIRKVTPQGIITTVAGNGSPTSSGDGGPATSAGMAVSGVAADKAGNLYIRDGFRVRKITASTGIIGPFAGNGTEGSNKANNVAATSAELNGISGIVVDASGNVYIGDDLDCVIRKVNTTGTISTAYGTGTCKASGDGGLATAAGLDPYYMALDPTGNLLTFGDVNNNTLRQINLTTGRISAFAGTGVYSFSGDGGPALSATISQVMQIAEDGAGNVIFADYNSHRIRKVTTSSNTINTIAGTSVADGPATGAFLDHPFSMTFDSAGKLDISDDGNSLVRQLNLTTGNISTLQAISGPFGIAADSSGNIYVGSFNWYIYKISSAGTITPFAGNGTFGYGGDGGPANKASISLATGIAVDSAGNVYFADNTNNVVRKIDTSGNISTIAGKKGNSSYAGEGGPATAATLAPYDVAVDKSGNVYVADNVNNRVVKFAPGGNIATIAGNGQGGYSGYPGPATQAQMLNPSGVTVDAAGNIYICATFGLVSVVDTTGTIRTIAGNATTYPFNGDGPALSANLDAVRVGISPTGGIYITDYANDRIRQLIQVNPTSVAIVSGNMQTGAVGTQLAQPLVVKVTGSDGNPYAGATVTFSSPSNAAFNPTSVMTAADGTASTTVTLGSTTGTVNVLATVTGVAPIAFSLTATAGAPLPAISAGGVVSAGLSIPTVQVASPNAILSIFGQNFAPGGTSRKVSGGDLVNGLVPTNLIGVCVMFGTQPAPMFLVTPGQLNVQAPQLPASGTVAVQVITNCGTANQLMSNTVNVAVQAAAPEFFYAASNANGQNPVAATDGLTMGGVGDPSRLGPGFALGYPGEIVVIYATGLGLTTPPYGAGALPPVATPVNNVTVAIDGTPLDPSAIQYAGVTPLLAGVYQLNVQLPLGLNPGDHKITISVNGATSPSGAYISTSPPLPM